MALAEACRAKDRHARAHEVERAKAADELYGEARQPQPRLAPRARLATPRNEESSLLIIAGKFLIDPTKRDAVIVAASEMMAETQKEAGCHAYTFSADFSDPTRFHLFERWESQSALEAHFAAPHMARFQAVLGKFGVHGLEVQKYTISAVGPVR
jgi:quinol monooxygenase YgiN